MIENVKYLLFDLDNTLLDFDKSSHASFIDLMNKLGVPELAEEYDVYDDINQRVWKRLEENKISQFEVRTLRWSLFWNHFGRDFDPMESNVEYLNGLANNGFWIDGSKGLLDKLTSSDYEMYIVTNGFREVQRRRLDKEQIAIKAKDIVISDEIGYSKPDKRFFDHLFGRNNHLSKNECLVIGDSLGSDIKGGNQYGLNTCWFNPNAKINGTDVIADIEIRSMTELQKLLGLQ